jgi:hypothetical protein
MLAFACGAFGILIGTVTWFALRGRSGWTGRDVAAVVVGVTGVGVALVSTFAGPLFVDWLTQKRRGPVLPGLTAARLEAWRAVLRVAVLDRRVRGEGSQLDQMVRQGAVVDLWTEARSEPPPAAPTRLDLRPPRRITPARSRSRFRWSSW